MEIRRKDTTMVLSGFGSMRTFTMPEDIMMLPGHLHRQGGRGDAWPSSDHATAHTA